jgi:hypothetical protein
MEREGTRFSAVVDEWTSNRNMQVWTMNESVESGIMYIFVVV